MKRNLQKEDQNGKRKRRILLLILLLLLLGILFCMLFHSKDINSGAPSDPSNAQGGIDLTIDPNAKADHSQASEQENNIEEQSVVIFGKGAITVSAGEREAYVDLYNPDKNEGLYYLTFELRLYDGNEQEYEVLYTSELVEPGKHIETITLSRALEKGVYNAVIHVQPYRMNEDKTPTNNADMKIQLIVK